MYVVKQTCGISCVKDIMTEKQQNLVEKYKEQNNSKKLQTDGQKGKKICTRLNRFIAVDFGQFPG